MRAGFHFRQRSGGGEGGAADQKVTTGHWGIEHVQH
jgi:hypothetical protein